MATTGIDSTTSAAFLTAAHGGTALSFGATSKLLLLSAVRTTDTGTDTEWGTSGGYTAGTGISGLSWAASSAGAPSTQATNASASLTSAPAQTLAGAVEVDNSGTPKKIYWYTRTGGNATVNVGDTVLINSGGIADSLG